MNFLLSKDTELKIIKWKLKKKFYKLRFIFVIIYFQIFFLAYKAPFSLCVVVVYLRVWDDPVLREAGSVKNKDKELKVDKGK